MKPGVTEMSLYDKVVAILILKAARSVFAERGQSVNQKLEKR